MKRVLSILMAFIFVMSSLQVAIPLKTQAANKKLTLSMVKAAALQDNDDYIRIKNKITLANTEYSASIKKIQLKEANQRSFRWSPLLSFKLPESPDLADEFEYTYKPLELQSQLSKLDHQLVDVVYAIYEEAELSMVSVYVLQEKISYNEKMLEKAEESLRKNTARLTLGQATQSDVDTMTKKVETLKNTVASLKRNFESEKEKLSELTGLDLKVGYTFESPFVEAELKRELLTDFKTRALEVSDTYYQAKTETGNALLALNTNYSLMKNQYGAKLSTIDSYINQAKNGKKIDSAAFKIRYNELLQDVDKPWQGAIRIWFIKIPKEWFKGEIDGVRYVEDDPYALYASAIEYQNAKKEQETTKKEIESLVSTTYDTYISERNSVDTVSASVEEKKKEVTKASVLNTTGRMTYEEYTDVQDEYDQLQIDLLDAKASLSSTLFSFNRMLGGDLQELFNLTSASYDSSDAGVSYVVDHESDGVYYFIHVLAAENMFEVGLAIPADYTDVEIDSYELWVDGVQIGGRTARNKFIRHLALDTQDVERVFIRLYSPEGFIDDCDIDPTVYSARLNITTEYEVVKAEETKVAAYSTSVNDMGQVEIRITPEPNTLMTSYNIRDDEGNYLIGEDKINILDSFKYLSAIKSDLKDLTICFYDEGGALLYEAEFRESDHTIHKKSE